MTWDELLAHCLAKPGAWRDEPWDGDVVVKVSSKIFAFLGSESASAVGLKCASTREAADEWRIVVWHSSSSPLLMISWLCK